MAAVLRSEQRGGWGSLRLLFRLRLLFLFPASLPERLRKAFRQGFREGFPDAGRELAFELVATLVEILPASQDQAALLWALRDLAERFEPRAFDDVRIFGLVVLQKLR